MKSVVKTDKVYISQTSRTPRSRTREHERAIFTGDGNSLLTQHCIKKTIMILTLTASRSLTAVHFRSVALNSRTECH